jgi:hypothetical protein
MFVKHSFVILFRKMGAYFVLTDNHQAIIAKIPKVRRDALQSYSTSKHTAKCRTFLFVP